jgi:hypothetical protein
MKRDAERELLELQDTETQKTYIVPYIDVWDIDKAVYVDNK